MPGFIPFKELAENIDVAAVAALLGLQLKASGKDLRCACPACGTDDARSLSVMPETNSFRCYAAEVSGDCIALYAHVNATGMYKAAKELQAHFSAPATAGRTVPATAPQKPEGRANVPNTKKAEPFDPQAYAAKLQYTEQVAALGISEDDAARLCVGYSSAGLLRGRVCFPIRNVDGSIAGFVGWNGQDLKLPTTWLHGNVVSFAKRA